LLNEINQDFQAQEMDYYRHLTDKRQEETITENELQELKKITCRLEALQVAVFQNRAGRAGLDLLTREHVPATLREFRHWV